jgi:hypothetical protein
MSSSEVIAHFGSGTDLTDEALQELMGTAVRLYAERVERGGDLAIVKPSAIAATEALLTTSALLRAVNVEVFELGLWQSFAQRGHDA